MTILIISIVAAWIIFSAILVTIICINSARFSQMDEPIYRSPGYLDWLKRENEEDNQNV